MLINAAGNIRAIITCHLSRISSRDLRRHIVLSYASCHCDGSAVRSQACLCIRSPYLELEDVDAIERHALLDVDIPSRMTYDMPCIGIVVCDLHGIAAFDISHT
jgi:hypothetical protein